MVNYSNGKIYKLVNNVDDKIYIGSTCDELRCRKWGHKSKLNRYPDYKVYKHLIQVGWGNVEIILIENYECKSKEELHARERHWIDELKPELNKQTPTLTKREYEQINKEKISERKKRYNQINKDRIEANRGSNYICICGKEIRKDSKSRHYKTKKHTDFINNQK